MSIGVQASYDVKGGYEAPNPGAYQGGYRGDVGLQGGYQGNIEMQGAYQANPGVYGGYQANPGMQVGYQANPGVQVGYQANPGMQVGYQANPGMQVGVGIQGGYQPNPGMNTGVHGNMHMQPNYNAGVQGNYGGGYGAPQYGGGVNVNVNHGNPQAIVVVQGVNSGNYVCGRAVPNIGHCGAILVLILNIFWPGFGTMIAGCIPPIEGDVNCAGHFCCFYWLGIAHFILCPIIVGWVLAIVFGCQLIQVANMGSTTTVVTKQNI